jgi:RhoGAP domain
LTPEQVVHCNTEEECSQLARTLPATQSALLDWAINLMADVVENEHYNKMNARNIAMVFAPNMTQVRNSSGIFDFFSFWLFCSLFPLVRTICKENFPSLRKLHKNNTLIFKEIA